MLKVLIVDDSEMLRELFAEYLGQVGFEVLGAVGTVPEAVEIAEAQRPDIALVDFHLGKQLGTEIISSLSAASRPAILYLSGCPFDRTLSREDGEAFIQKPVSLADLAVALMAVWELKASSSRDGVSVPTGLRWLPERGSQIVPSAAFG